MTLRNPALAHLTDAAVHEALGVLRELTLSTADSTFHQAASTVWEALLDENDTRRREWLQMVRTQFTTQMEKQS